ncbi:hypothetical protein HPB48_012258 [Haemaphysalis longicornis]|uniref:CCHC-type domain-containing protein n=1 Tax=Haemaphysalis longicornis TaxID=44386 RepID=A0A9J6GHQ4_HAELO|nr:hypothetical protein HPB48_012258 [Haemaphysalis longicornis]
MRASRDTPHLTCLRARRTTKLRQAKHHPTPCLHESTDPSVQKEEHLTREEPRSDHEEPGCSQRGCKTSSSDKRRSAVNLEQTTASSYARALEKSALAFGGAMGERKQDKKKTVPQGASRIPSLVDVLSAALRYPLRVGGFPWPLPHRSSTCIAVPLPGGAFFWGVSTVPREEGVDRAAGEEPAELEVGSSHRTSPPIIGVRRMGRSESVIITFADPQVPRWVECFGSPIKCFLCRKKYEVCSKCGNIGHRSDVCSNNPTEKCRKCGDPSPASEHVHRCVPKCQLCGKEHATGDKRCKALYRTPYVLKKRQWERKLGEQATKEEADEKRRHREAQSTIKGSQRAIEGTKAGIARGACLEAEASRGTDPSPSLACHL